MRRIERLNGYLCKRKKIMKEARTIANLIKYEYQLQKMFTARVFKPSEKDTYDTIKTCTEIREVLINDTTHNQEYDFVKDLSLDSIGSCYHFINKILELLMKNKSKHSWYMQPIVAETMTLGEVLMAGAAILLIILMTIK